MNVLLGMTWNDSCQHHPITTSLAGPNSSLQFLPLFPCFTSLRNQESHGMQDLMSCGAAVVAARSLQIELLVPEFRGLLA